MIARPPAQCPHSLDIVARWLAFAVLAAYLLFGHIGCHGDDDADLFAHMTQDTPSAAGRPQDHP